FDNFVSPGNALTEARVPFQNDVGLVNQQYGSIRGQHFLFDTGAQVTVISTREAHALGLDLQPAQFTTLLEGGGGSQPIAGSVVDERDLPTSDGGLLEFGNVPVFVADLGQGVDGILGMNLLNSATAMLFDPFGPGGASVSFTFPKAARVVDSTTADLFNKLDRLGLSFAGAIHGSQLPGLTFDTGAISGQVFLDYNGNGKMDPAETGLPGQTVFPDLNNSGNFDPGDPSAVTDANGFYQFRGLAAGTYTVRQVVSAGFAALEPAAAQVVVLPGSSVTEVRLANMAM